MPNLHLNCRADCNEAELGGRADYAACQDVWLEEGMKESRSKSKEKNHVNEPSTTR